jgi:biopolymer transport protein ExbD
MASKLTQLSAVEEDPNVDSSSMIDMVFQLLLFFMVSSRLLLNTIDPAIEIPVASNAKPPEEHAGRIVIHVYEDGGFGGKNRAEEPLPDLISITNYVEEKKLQMEKGVTPKILLRGDKASIVKHSKQVVKAAGDAGVNTIIFSAFPTAKGGG